MARARNIKPAFFTNEMIAENDPLARLLFIGMWTIADHNGNFEWRPKRIKVQLLPYDECDIEEIAINLEKSRLITFYSVNDKTYVHIHNFTKHQNPHPNEKKKGTDIPEFTQVIDSKRVTINHDKSRQVSEDSTSDPADSLLLIPSNTYIHATEIIHRLKEAGIDERDFLKTKPRQMIDRWLKAGITVADLDKSISRALEAMPEKFCTAYLDPIVLQEINNRKNPQKSEVGGNEKHGRTGKPRETALERHRKQSKAFLAAIDGCGSSDSDESIVGGTG